MKTRFYEPTDVDDVKNQHDVPSCRSRLFPEALIVRSISCQEMIAPVGIVSESKVTEVVAKTLRAREQFQLTSLKMVSPRLESAFVDPAACL